MPDARGLRWWYVFVVVSAAAIVAAFRFDDAARIWLLQHRTSGVQSFMQIISRVGDWPAHVALGVLLLAIAWWSGRREWIRVCVAMLIACAVAGVAARAMKITTGRPRPSVEAVHAWNGPAWSEKYHAFPSGHTAASAAFFGVLAFRRPRIGAPLLLIPAIIALSRMYVAAHYLSDVVCAYLLGLICAWLVARAIEHRRFRTDK